MAPMITGENYASLQWVNRDPKQIRRVFHSQRLCGSAAATCLVDRPIVTDATFGAPTNLDWHVSSGIDVTELVASLKEPLLASALINNSLEYVTKHNNL